MTNTLTEYKQKQLDELRDKVRSLLPGGNKLTLDEAELTARAAIYYGLDPFTGEIWPMKGRNGEWRGVAPGIKGYRRKAREQMRDGNYWISYRELTDEEARVRWCIPKGALAFEARLFDSETMATYVQTIRTLREAGIGIEVILNMVGEQPYTVGVGYVKIIEQGDDSRMTPIQKSLKRAEADAIKRRFDLNLPDVVVEDDSVETTAVIEHTQTGAEAARDLYGEKPHQRTNGNPSPPVVRIEHGNAWSAPSDGDPIARIRAMVAEIEEANINNKAEAATDTIRRAAIDLATLCGTDDARKAVVATIFGVATMRHLSVAQCAALRKWINVSKNQAGEWIPSAQSVADLPLILAATPNGEAHESPTSA